MPVASQVSFRLDGPEFEGGIPILKLTEALKQFHSTVDKGYLAILGKERITRFDRTFYRLTATKIAAGSFYSEIEIIVPAAQFALSFVPAGIALSHVWEVVKSAFAFLKTVASARKEGKEPRVQVTTSGDSTKLLVIGSQNNIEVNHIVLNTAGQAEPHIKSLAKLVDGDHISSLSVLDNKKEGIHLLPADNNLFNPTTVIEDKALEVSAKIFRLDVESRTGRLRTLEAEAQAEYPFQIIGRQSLHPYVLALEQDRTGLRVLREIVRHPTGAEIVHGFHLLGVLG
jgi:hypothetical protein